MSKGRLFFGDVEIPAMESFTINSGDFQSKEAISFNGIYDPPDPDIEELLREKDEITGTVHGVDGETKEARLKILAIADGGISLEPIEEDAREWVKVHVFGINEKGE